MFQNLNKVSFWIFAIFILLVQQIIYQPLIGDVIANTADHGMFMYHWIIGSIWFKKNFLATPWFSPAQCMAFPFYANPQNLYYSISQIFFIIFSPTTALRVYFLFLSIVSFFGMYFLLRKTLKISLIVSILGSTLFLFNGYSIERFLSSHYGTVLFAYIPFYIFIVSQTINYNFRQRHFYFFVIVSSVILSQIIYGGSAALTPHILLSTLVAVLIISLLLNNRKLIINFCLSLSISLLLSVSKINAGLQLLNNFPRETHLNPFKVDSFFYVLQNIIAGLFFYPITYENRLIPKNPGYLKDLPNLFVHELNYNLSVVPLIIIILFLSNFFLKKKNFNFKELIEKNFKIKIFLFLLLIFPILINLDYDILDLLRKLPILNDLWVNVRFFLIYIIPVIIISCLFLNKLKLKNINLLVSVFVFLAIAQSNSFPKKLYKDHSGRNYNDKDLIKKIYNPNYQIKKIALIFHKKVKKDGTFAYGKIKGSGLSIPLVSQLYNSLTMYDCYEPILGYQLEHQPKTKLVIDFSKKDDFDKDITVFYADPFWEDDDHLNFNNPICELFPKENLCMSLGDKFKIKDKKQLTQLLNFKPIFFEKSVRQKISDYLSLLIFILMIIFFIYFIFKQLVKNEK